MEEFGVTYKTRICGKISLELVSLAFIIKTGSSAAGMILHGCSWRFQTSREFIFQLFDSTFLAYASFLAFLFWTRDSAKSVALKRGIPSNPMEWIDGDKKEEKKSDFRVFFFLHIFFSKKLASNVTVSHPGHPDATFFLLHTKHLPPPHSTAPTHKNIPVCPTPMYFNDAPQVHRH